jgi:hypothetical protein
VCPSYGFETFDRLLEQLREVIPRVAVRAEVLAALRMEGRQLDRLHLGAGLNLEPRAVGIIERLATWGDTGSPVHVFGSVCLVGISVGSLGGKNAVTTYVMASRKGGQIRLWWVDESGRHGDLGACNHPLSMLEMIVVVDAVLLAHAPNPLPDGDWQDGYISDQLRNVRVRSEVYPELGRWYDSGITKWLATHRTDG